METNAGTFKLTYAFTQMQICSKQLSPHATLSKLVSHQPIKCTAPPLLSLFPLRYYWGPQTQTPTSTPTPSILDFSNQ